MKQFMLRRLGVARDMGQTKPSLHDCLETILEQSDNLMDDVLTGLQLALLPANSKTLHALQNPAGRVAIEHLFAQGDVIKKTFAAELRAVVYGGDAQRKGAQPLVRFDDFQFLEEEQIDANIEFAMTQQEVLLAVDPVLPALNGLISSLLGWTSVQGHLNPVKPESFVHALRESFAGHVTDENVRSAVMNAAAGLLGSSLLRLYKEVVSWLRTQGVESIATAAASVGEFGTSTKAPENSVTRTLLTLDKLRKLLSGELDPKPLAGGIKDFTHTVPASYDALEDLKLLEPMMKRLAERVSQSDAAAQAGQDGVRRDRGQSKSLGRELGQEVVQMMLENLVQDQRLMPGVRQSLKSMETVLIRLSQADARFFSDRQHPARQFLDKITSRSLAFSSEEQPGYARFLKSLENSVSVLVGGQGDAAAIARLLRKLEEAWMRDEHDQRLRAEEAARGLLHAEQRNMLAERLANDFAQKLQNKGVPEMVAAFLRGPWAQVVAQAQLGCTDGTADADGYLSLVDDLIWSVQLRLARRNRTRLVELLPGMLVKMRLGLNLISYPTERTAAFFDELVTFHENAFEGSRAQAATPSVPAAPSAAVPAGALWMADSEVADSGYLEDAADSMPALADLGELPETGEAQEWSVDALATGSWVNLALGGQWVRAQLTWTSPHRTLFMFMSGGGLAHSMSRRTMDRLRALGLIRLVSDGRVIDNALDAVAQTALRNEMDKPVDPE